MISLIVLTIAFVVLRMIGWTGVEPLNHWHPCLQIALAIMLLVTASAHWGKRRAEMIRMVPPFFSRPAMLVSLTGILEIMGAIGLVIPFTVINGIAAIGLFLLMLALFPANVHAARQHLTLGGRPVTPLPLRTAMQLLYLVLIILASPWFA